MDISELVAVSNSIGADFISGKTSDSEILAHCHNMLNRLGGQTIFGANMQGENLTRFMKTALDPKGTDILDILRSTRGNASLYETAKSSSNKLANTRWDKRPNPYSVRAYERYSATHDLRKTVFVKGVVRRFHAAFLISGALISFSGLSQTGPAGFQLRVLPDQRSGFCARAFA